MEFWGQKWMYKLCVCLLGLVSQAADVRVERTEVPGGGELVTYFRTVMDPASGASEVPLVSILRDTMGDANPENDQLRNVWAFTYTRPSVFKRLAASVPFLYERMGRSSGNGAPPPIVDIAAAGKGTIPRLASNLAQTNAFDPLGMPYRATTRAYRSRAAEYRTMQIWRTLDVLSTDGADSHGLTESELTEVRGRVLLSRRLFGGWVRSRYMAPAWNRFETASTEDRGRNWEMLRQRAEENRLYFQPLDRNGRPAWFDRALAGSGGRFDSKFLDISDPFRDPRLERWTEYSETWQLDGSGSPVSPGTDGASPAEMIPLALYALDHPKVPLVLIDFRDPGKPWRREAAKRAADDIATGVLGWTGYGNLSYLAAKTSWSFVHRRHGGALDRSARLRAYVQLRQTLISDTHMDAALRRDLSARLERFGLNPFDNASHAEQDIARRQYQALIAKARAGGLAASLADQRNREVGPLVHRPSVRLARKVATAVTLGAYRHRDPQTTELLALVDRRRRVHWHMRYLEGVLAAGPWPEVVADMRAVRHSMDELTALSAENTELRNEVAQLVSAIMARSDEATRAECRRCLSRLADVR